MDVIDEEFYIPKDMQDVSGVDKLSDGKTNAVGLLYSDNDLEQYPCDNNQNCFGIGVQDEIDYFDGKPTWTATMILPSGVADFYAIEAGSLMKLTSMVYDDDSYVD